MPTVQINRIGSICRTEGQNPRRSLNKEDFVKFKPDSTYLNFNPWIRKRQYVSDLIKMQYYSTGSYQCESSRRSWYTFFFWYASFSITSWCMIDQFVLFTFFLRYYHKNVSAFFLFRSVLLLQYPIRNVFSIHIMSVHESKLFCNFLERSFFADTVGEDFYAYRIFVTKSFLNTIYMKSWVRFIVTYSSVTVDVIVYDVDNMSHSSDASRSSSVCLWRLSSFISDVNARKHISCHSSSYVFRILCSRTVVSPVIWYCAFASYSLILFPSQGVQKYISFSLFFFVVRPIR